MVPHLFESELQKAVRKRPRPTTISDRCVQYERLVEFGLIECNLRHPARKGTRLAHRGNLCQSSRTKSTVVPSPSSSSLNFRMVCRCRQPDQSYLVPITLFQPGTCCTPFPGHLHCLCSPPVPLVSLVIATATSSPPFILYLAALPHLPSSDLASRSPPNPNPPAHTPPSSPPPPTSPPQQRGADACGLWSVTLRDAHIFMLRCASKKRVGVHGRRRLTDCGGGGGGCGGVAPRRLKVCGGGGCGRDRIAPSHFKILGGGCGGRDFSRLCRTVRYDARCASLLHARVTSRSCPRCRDCIRGTASCLHLARCRKTARWRPRRSRPLRGRNPVLRHLAKNPRRSHKNLFLIRRWY